MIILDETWTLLVDPAFVAQITEWLKTMRKKNVGVAMATQSLSDLLGTKRCRPSRNVAQLASSERILMPPVPPRKGICNSAWRNGTPKRSRP